MQIPDFGMAKLPTVTTFFYTYIKITGISFFENPQEPLPNCLLACLPNAGRIQMPISCRSEHGRILQLEGASMAM